MKFGLFIKTCIQILFHTLGFVIDIIAGGILTSVIGIITGNWNKSKWKEAFEFYHDLWDEHVKILKSCFLRD